jgi:serine/threonine protein kinase
VIGLPADSILKITVQLTFGLCAIHQKGIVHGNINPESILIQNDNGHKKVLLCNFKSDQSWCQTEADISQKVYISRDAHQSDVSEQKCDWESLCFLVYSMMQTLPWQSE